MNGIGIGPTDCFPSACVSDGIPVTALPFVITRLIPPYTPCIPIVATIEFRRRRVMIIPLINPKISPRINPITRQSHGFNPTFTINIPVKIPDRQAILPTDKSSSPTNKSSDCAIPIMPTNARSRSTDCKLYTFKKYGDTILAIIIITTSIAAIAVILLFFNALINAFPDFCFVFSLLIIKLPLSSKNLHQ